MVTFIYIALLEKYMPFGNTFCNFGSHIQTEYAVFVEGTDELAGRFAAVCCVSLENLKQYYEEKFDRGNFINWILNRM